MKDKRDYLIEVTNKNTGEVEQKSLAEINNKEKRIKYNYHYFLTFYPSVIKDNITINPVFAAILGYMNSENKIDVTPTMINSLRTNYKISANKLRVNLFRMIKKGLLLKINNNLYFANPSYISKSAVIKIRQLEIEYLRMFYEQKREKETEQTIKPTISEPKNKYLRVVK